MTDATRRPSGQVSWLPATSTPVETAILLALALLQCWLIFQHASWRDEEQALLVVQQPLGVVFAQLHYEGHPALYYLVLKAATLALPGTEALKLVAAACSLGTLTLIWWRSPFSLFGKVALSLNYLILFEYGVIARSYGLGAFLFFAFVAVRQVRGLLPWVLLALLVNVSIHTAILAAVCALWLWREDRWSWKGCAILGLGFGVTLLTLWPAHDVIGSISVARTPIERGMVTLAKTAGLLIWSDPTHPVAVWNGLPQTPAVFVVGALIPLIGIAALNPRRDHQALFLLCFLILFGFGAAVYVALLRHMGFAALLLVGLLWAQAEAGARLNIAARGWLTLAALGGVWFAVTAFAAPFSASTALSDWARQAGRTSKPWATAWGPIGVYYSSIAGQPTFNLQKGCWNTYQRWNYDTGKPVGDADIAAFAQAAGESYLLSQAPLEPAPGRQLEQRFDGVIGGESVYVYRIWPTGPTRLRALPTCR